MKKTNQAKKTGMVMLTICLLWLVACKRDQFQPLTPNVLSSYRGTDKIVLQVVEELKKPDNKALLAEIEKQGSINWEYQALITSRFLDGITLRFATGSNGDYLDAEVNAETKAIGLFNKQQQQQRDAVAQQAFGNKPKGNSTQAGVCTYNLSFELAASPDLNILQFLTGLLNIRFFLEAKGFIGGINSGSTRIFYQYVVFEAINNETETEVRTLLRDAIAAFCTWIGSQDSSCWLILGLTTTSSCDAEDNNNPGTTVWGINRDQALSSLNTTLWNHQACSAAQYAAERQFETIYRSYIANATSASADIFRTRLSLLLSDVPSIVAIYCRNVPPDPGTPVNPGGGGGGSIESNALSIDIDLLTRINYPILGKIVDNLLKKVKNDTKLLTLIKKFSNLSTEQVLYNLTFGKGPKLVVNENFPSYKVGEFKDGIIYINKSHITQSSYIYKDYSTALEFYITVSILHEFIHFGENYSQIFLPYEGQNNDAGFQFENAMYGGRVYFNPITGTITYEKL